MGIEGAQLVLQDHILLWLNDHMLWTTNFDLGKTSWIN